MKRLKILIVDDDPEISGFIRLKLSKDAPHFKIAQVESSQDCLDYLNKNDVDCILSDLQMPRMNGMELLTELRARGVRIPFIFITGQGNEELAREAFKAGAHDYFTKDIGFAHFTRIINSVEQAVKNRVSEENREKAEAALLAEKNKLEAINRLYSVISQTNKAILRAPDKGSLMEEACRIAVEQGLFRMAWVGLADKESGDVRPVASHGNVDGYLDEIRVSAQDEPEGRGPVGRAIRDGAPFVVNDLESDPNMVPWREKALRRGYRSLAAFPIMNGEEIIGAFAVYSGEPGMFDGEETALMAGLAADISFALQLMEKGEKSARAEEALRESEQRYKDLVELSSDFIYRSDKYGNQTFMNDAAYRTLEASPEEVVGLPWEKWIHPEDRENTMRCFMEMIEKGIDVFNFENRFVSKSGRLISVLHNVKVLRDENGAIAGTQGIARDITERKLAEEALRESETLFRSLVEESVVGVFIIQGGRFAYVNPRAAHMFGYTQAEAVDGASILDIVHPHDRELIENNMRRGFSGEIGSMGLMFKGIRKDGSVLDVEAFGTMTRYNGRPAAIGTVLDISERRRAEEENSAFFHMLTHDIKGPLSVVYGYCDMVRQVSGQDVRAMVSEIQKAARRISALIDDMLALSRLESKEAKLVIRPVSLAELLRQAVRDNEMLASENEISVTVESDPAIPKVYADGAQLARALSNLVANAVNYNGKGGKVSLKAYADGNGTVTVEVADNGVGIAAQDIPHLFDKYYRGRRSDKRRGTGLGLAIVKAAIDAHGGSVSVESVKGKGSTFTVTLPVRQNPPG